MIGFNKVKFELAKDVLSTKVYRCSNGLRFTCLNLHLTPNFLTFTGKRFDIFFCICIFGIRKKTTLKTAYQVWGSPSYQCQFSPCTFCISHTYIKMFNQLCIFLHYDFIDAYLFTACPELGDFQCRDERCIPAVFHCDGYEDCYTAEDELECTSGLLPYIDILSKFLISIFIPNI